jgi:hypothetical protein
MSTWRASAALESKNSQGAIRSLTLLTTLPLEFWQGQEKVVVDISGRALREMGTDMAVVEAYRTLMDHAEEVGPRHVLICLYGQALFHALQHPAMQLENTVTRTFSTLHEFICHSRAEHDERYSAVFSAFPVNVWDKANLLRRWFAMAFLNSRWPRLDFALATRDPKLFRTLLPIVRNLPGGDQFLSELSGALSASGGVGKSYATELHSFLHPSLFSIFDDWLL